MPNQRAANKRVFGVSFELDLIKEIDDYCKKHSMNRVEFLKKAARMGLKLNNINQKGKK